jgi:hypothetical protein
MIAPDFGVSSVERLTNPAKGAAINDSERNHKLPSEGFGFANPKRAANS